MLVSVTSGVWTAIFTGLTALAGFCVAAVALVRFWQHWKRDRDPIRVSNWHYSYPMNTELIETLEPVVANQVVRLAQLRFTNRADVEMSFTIDTGQTHLNGATEKDQTKILNPVEAIAIKPGQGVTVPIIFSLPNGDKWTTEATGRNVTDYTHQVPGEFVIEFCGRAANGREFKKSVKSASLYEYDPTT